MRTLYVQVDDAGVDGAFPVRVGAVGTGSASAELVLADAGYLPAHTACCDRADLYKTLTEGGGEHLVAELKDDGPLSVVLDVRPPQLRALGWESMVLDQWYPFLDPARPWSRGRWNSVAVGPSLLGPLRVLVVVCAPTGDPSLHAEEELEGIHRVIADHPGRLHLEVVDAPQSWAALRATIIDLAPQVVHLIGHARPLAAGGSVLEFTDRVTGRTWELSSTTVRNNWPAGARLLLFSACRSTQERPSEGLVALTDAARGAGVTAVLGMCGDIRSTVAVAFARGFYAALARGCPVDKAVAEGRAEAFSEAQGDDDWSYPVLEAGVPPCRVLPVCYGMDGEAEQRLPSISEFAELRRFVDRTDQRRRIWWALDAEGVATSPAERGAAVVTGPRKNGKSALVKAVLLTYYLRGRRLQYVDLGAVSSQGGQSKDWLAVLRTIRDGVPGCGLCEGLRPESFNRFNARLNWLLARPPRVGMPDEVRDTVPDDGSTFDHDAGQAQLRIETIFKDFLDALERAASGSKLILALDGVESVLVDAWRQYVVPLLIRPLAQGRPGVRLLLALPDDALERYLTSAERSVMEEVRVDGFAPDDVPRLVREYGARARLSPGEVDRILGFVRDFGPLPPVMFSYLEDGLRLASVAGPR